METTIKMIKVHAMSEYLLWLENRLTYNVFTSTWALKDIDCI